MGNPGVRKKSLTFFDENARVNCHTYIGTSSRPYFDLMSAMILTQCPNRHFRRHQAHHGGCSTVSRSDVNSLRKAAVSSNWA